MGKKIIEKRMPRSIGGKIVKWTFILFNILMLLWMIGGLNSATDTVNEMTNEYEKAGATIGTGIGMFMITIIWGFGVIVLSPILLLTRGTKVMEEIDC